MMPPNVSTEQGDSYMPAALLSLLPGKDLFDAQCGCRAGNYMPSAFRASPFRLAASSGRPQVLCIEEDSGLIDDGDASDGTFNFGDR